MFAIIPRNDVMLASLLQKKVDVTEVTEFAMNIYLDCDIIDTLKQVKEHDELSVSNRGSVIVKGKCTREEIRSLLELEDEYALKIIKVEHDFLLEEEEIHSDQYFVTAILHEEETQRFIVENLHSLWY